MDWSRRALLRSMGGGAVTLAAVGGSNALAGCLQRTPVSRDELAGDVGDSGEDGDGAGSDSGGRGPPPLADQRLYLGHDLDTIDGNVRSGGVSQDGIPSIDEPRFAPASDVDLDPGEPVFGLVRGDDVRAYPQAILVYHEIVNDVVDGDPVAVTYCPLTGTAQGFERGAVEFGVSGRLVNSNLVMYDRGTDTWWPQMIATGIRGQERGETLREFRLVWTTWANWVGAHPDTQVLTERTGYARRYGSDPYGSYNPPSGYYAQTRIMFSPLAEIEHGHPKDVVIGARTTEGAIAFDKQSLLSERVRTGDLAGTAHVAVADDVLKTAYVYANPGGATIEPLGSQYAVTGDGAGGETLDGESFAADSLPLERVYAFDAMWFAWYGFYPETTYVE